MSVNYKFRRAKSLRSIRASIPTGGDLLVLLFEGIWQLAWFLLQALGVALTALTVGGFKASRWGARKGWTAYQTHRAKKQGTGSTDTPRADATSEVDSETARRINAARKRAARENPNRSTQTTTASGSSGAPRVDGSNAMKVEAFKRWVNASRPVGELDPATAWDLDAHLAAWTAVWLRFAQPMGQYAETLDRVVRVDPRVVQAYMAATSNMLELVQSFQTARMLFRTLYGPQLEAAETGGVRQPKKPDFWVPEKSEEGQPGKASA